eukprot:Rhum_TRINITY_DN14186_c3_g2::Rhum_TRINITY_DN14186_c3_g2_i1::g.72932::m.72932
MASSKIGLLFFLGLLVAVYVVFMVSVSGVIKSTKQNQADITAISDAVVRNKDAIDQLRSTLNSLRDDAARRERNSGASKRAANNEGGVDNADDAEQRDSATGNGGGGGGAADKVWSEAAFLRVSNYTDPLARHAAENPALVREIVKEYYESDGDTHALQGPLHRALDYIMVRDCEEKAGGKRGCIDGFVLPTQADKYFEWGASLAPTLEADAPTLCETGFNAGHSAATFLLANKKLRMVSFDLFIQAYSRSCLAYLKAVFGEQRVTVHKGDSKKSLDTLALAPASSRQQCDVVSIDGAHSFAACLKDVKGLSKLVARDATPVVMDDTAEGFEMKGGPAEVWRKLKKEDKLKQTRCVTLGVVQQWKRGSKPKPRGFCIGEINVDLKEFQ